MLELTMASVSGDAGETAGMLMADAPSEPGAVLRDIQRAFMPRGWGLPPARS